MRLLKRSIRAGTSARQQPSHAVAGLEALGLKTSDVMRAMSVTFALNATFVLVSPFAGLGVFATTGVRIAGLVALICAAIWHLMSKLELSSLWLHVPNAASYALYVWGGIAVGEARGAFAIILVSAAIATATTMPHRSFWIYPPIAFVAILVGIDPEYEPLYLVRVAALTLILVLMVVVATINRRAQIRLVARNRRLADIDPLTGLGNLRALKERLKAEAHQVDIDRHQLAIVSVDTANFSAVNEHCGRSAGDQFLREVGQSITQLIEPADLVVRVRADGFAVMVLLDGVRDVHAVKIEIADSVARIGRRLAPQLRPTANVGHVVRRADEPIDLLLHRAIDNHVAFRASEGQADSQRIGALSADIVLGEPAPVSYSQSENQSQEEAPTDTRNPWLMAVAATAVLGALPLAAGFLGAEAFGSLTAQLAALGLLALACLGSGMTRDGDHHTLLLQAYMFTALILMTTVIATAGHASAAILDFYLLPALFLLYSATPNQRSSWIVGGVMIGGAMGLFAYFLHKSGHPYTNERIFITMQMLLVDGSVFARQEARIRRLQLKGDALLGVDRQTGLANLRRLHERIDREVARRGLLGGSFGVIAFELDDVAIARGNWPADTPPTVMAAAQVIDAAAPRGALSARRGEAEFAIVVGGSELQELRDLADRTARAIAGQQPRELIDPVVWGCAVWRPGETRDDLMRRADNALKRSRRSQKASLLAGRRPDNEPVASAV